MGDLTKNFSKREFMCKCGCGQSDIDVEFVNTLQEVRDEATKLSGKDFKMPIMSGYRCPKHNNNVSSTGGTGPHTTGCAVDVPCSGNDSHTLLRAALSKGITGVGVKQKGPHKGRFLHLDTLTKGPRPWVWSY